MKLNGVDRLFMEARNEELGRVRRELAVLKKKLAQRSDTKSIKPCKCGRIDYGPIICAKCGGSIWQES